MTLEEATQQVIKLAEINGGKVNATINFQFDEGVIHLDDTVSPSLVGNEEKEASCTIQISLSNFEKLLNGSLNSMMAFMAGKMKVDGDKGAAMKLASLF